MSGPQHLGRHFTCRECGHRVTVRDGRGKAPTPEPALAGEGEPGWSDFEKSHDTGGTYTGDDWFEDQPAVRPDTPRLDMMPGYQPPVVATEYAGFWRRFAAAMLDGLILGFAMVLLMIAGYAALTLLGMEDDEVILLVQLGGNAVGIVIQLAYFTLFEGGRRQATPGKMFMDIIVTDLDSLPVSYGRAFARNLLKEVLYLFFCLGWIGFVMIAFTERKQGLHDMIAGCLVVRRS